MQDTGNYGLKTVLVNFFQKYRTVLLILLGGILLALGIVAGLLEWQRQVQLGDVARVSALLQDLEKAGEEGEAREAAIGALSAATETVNGYARSLALISLGQEAASRENWSQALTYFEKIAQNETQLSALLPAALWNAANAAEKAGDTTAARRLLSSLVDLTQAEAQYLLPAAHFALGRVTWESGEKEQALTEFQKLVDKFPDSDWTNAARSFILKQESRP